MIDISYPPRTFPPGEIVQNEQFLPPGLGWLAESGVRPFPLSVRHVEIGP
jgi:hypothetical protein